MEDLVLPQLYSCLSSLDTTFVQKNKSLLFPHLKTIGDSTLSMELLSKSYLTKENTLKGMLVIRGSR
jgi:hypothetical protein